MLRSRVQLTERHDARESSRVQEARSSQLGTRQTILGAFAFDGEGYVHEEGGAEHARVKVGVANRAWSPEDREGERML